MTKNVKVPKSIQEVFDEATACDELARLHSRWILPSPKSLVYASKAVKLRNFAWKSLAQVEPDTVGKALADNVLLTYVWAIGEVVFPQEPAAPTIKKTRKPRAPKAAPAAQPTLPTTGA